MKKFLKSIILAFAILVPISFLAICIYANKRIEEEGKVDPSMLSYFYETYDENREQFRKTTALLKTRFLDVEISRLIVPSKMDTDLSIDTVYIPAQNKTNKLIIMTSGVHGIEGFAGSAIQRYFMNEVLDAELLQNTGVLLIHAINPYGFKFGRRVSENKVDLNRNFDVDKGLFAVKNDNYTKVNKILNPRKKATAGYFENGVFFIKTVRYILQHSMKILRTSILKGQYEFKNGIFYGGNDFEPQKKWLENLISGKLGDYNSVFVIDIHTGYGKRGKLHILPGYVQDKKRNALLETTFKDYAVDRPSNENKFIIVKGGFRDYVGNLINTDKNYIGVVFEFGTLNSQNLFGSVRSLHNMIIENQAFHHGNKNRKTEEKIKKRFREMFFPSSKKWRSQIMKQAVEILPVLTDRFAKLKS